MGWLDGVFGDCLWVLWRDENPMKTKMELLAVSPLTRPTLQDFVYTEHEISGSSMCFTGPSLRLNVGFLSMLCWIFTVELQGTMHNMNMSSVT